MDLSQFNWGYVALGVSALLALLWLVVRASGKPGVGGALVSLPFLIVAMINSVAPILALIDAAFRDYQFGLLGGTSGWRLSATAGGVFLIALVCALAALRPGRLSGAIVVAGGLLFAGLLGWPWLQTVLTGNRPPLLVGGVVLPGVAASALFFLVLVAPFLIAAVWGMRRLATGR